jgi:hypothetical protein
MDAPAPRVSGDADTSPSTSALVAAACAQDPAATQSLAINACDKDSSQRVAVEIIGTCGVKRCIGRHVCFVPIQLYHVSRAITHEQDNVAASIAHGSVDGTSAAAEHANVAHGIDGEHDTIATPVVDGGVDGAGDASGDPHDDGRDDHDGACGDGGGGGGGGDGGGGGGSGAGGGVAGGGGGGRRSRSRGRGLGLGGDSGALGSAAAAHGSDATEWAEVLLKSDRAGGMLPHDVMRTLRTRIRAGDVLRVRVGREEACAAKDGRSSLYDA